MQSERPLRVLLVEDDPGDQELVRRALDEGTAPKQLHSVADGQEAVDFLFRQGKYRNPAASPRPDLVLLDLNMPRMGGMEVLARIRANPQLSEIPVVALTTSRRQEDFRRALELGANSYIVKPSDMECFVRALQDVTLYWLARTRRVEGA